VAVSHALSRIFNDCELSDKLSEVANSMGTRVLKVLQELVSGKALEKASHETRCALFLTLVATIISVQYHRVWIVRFRSLKTFKLTKSKQYSQRPDDPRQINHSELARILNHHMILVGQTAKLLPKELDRNIFFPSDTAFWRRIAGLKSGPYCA
jgi:hypothetical protein